MEEEISYKVPTLTDKLSRDDLKAYKIFFGPDSFVHDHTKDHRPLDSSGKDTPLDLLNISKIRKNPNCSLSNLALNNTAVLASELEAVYKGELKLLVDSTTFENGRSEAKMAELENYGNLKTGMTYLPNFDALLKNQITKEAKIVLS